MDNESFERSSAKIEHNPSIKRHTDFHEEEMKQNKKDVFRIFGFICSITSFIVVVILTNYIFKNNGEDSILFKLLGDKPNSFILKITKAGFVLSFIITLYSALYFLLMLIRLLLTKNCPEKIFIPNVIGKFSFRFAFVLAMIVGLAYSTAVFEEFDKKFNPGLVIDMKLTPETKIGLDDDKKMSFIDGLVTNFSDKIFEIFVKIVLAFLLRDLITYALNFNVHYKYYHKRIERNTEKITILRLMNDAINAGYTGDIDVISTRLVQVLTMGRAVPNDGTSPLVTLTDLQKFFGEATALKIFEYCNREGEIGEEEIKGFYVSTLVEQASIVKSIEQHNSTVENFRSILNILVFTIACYLFMEVIPGTTSSLLGNSTFLMGLIFSTNYTFSDSIKAFANNLCFVFLIRPYEVGDIIYSSDSLYKVKEVNLMSTLLYDGCKYMIVPNQRMAGDAIKNLRINRVFDVEYKCQFPVDSFETRSKALLDHINDYIKKKSSEFHRYPFYKGSPVTNNGMIETTLVIKFNCDVADIEVLNERRTNFFNVLTHLLKKQ